MSLNSALQVSRSGLEATQAWSDLTSRNIANANTEGYVRKDVSLSTLAPGTGGGGVVSEVKREVDASLDRMYRSETGKMAKQQQIYEGVQAYTAVLGTSSSDTSPLTKLTALQTSFDTLVNSPGDAAAQRGTLDAAKALTVSLNNTAGALQQVGSEVTTEIKYNVTDVNRALLKIADLNKSLTSAVANSTGSTELQDAVGQQVQAVAKIMDVQLRTDGMGRVSLYTSGGTQLIDGSNVASVRYDQA
nr:flagellar basal body protein [Allgaiera sp.]